jgi:hypothetical protein
VNPTPILEENQQPEVEAMKVDIPATTKRPQSEEEETLKEVQLERTKTTLEVNGMMPNSEATVEPDESQTTISEHLAGEIGEYVSSWSEWVTKEQPKATRTLSQPPLQQKDKI